VRNEALKELDSLKTTHEIVPLNVIDNEMQALPSDIKNVLPDALVEVTFYMEYYQNHTVHGRNNLRAPSPPRRVQP